MINILVSRLLILKISQSLDLFWWASSQQASPVENRDSQEYITGAYNHHHNYHYIIVDQKTLLAAAYERIMIAMTMTIFITSSLSPEYLQQQTGSRIRSMEASISTEANLSPFLQLVFPKFPFLSSLII